jgi:hypothetical protein
MYLCHIFKLVHCAELTSLLLRDAIVNSLCSVCILLVRLVNSGSPYSMMNGSRILSPSCCTGYNLYSLHIYVHLRVFCSPAASAPLYTKGKFAVPYTRCVYDYTCCTCNIFSPPSSLPPCISATPFSI